MKAYILFDNKFYNKVVIDKFVLNYLLDDLKSLGFNEFVGVRYGLDIEINKIDKYLDYEDLFIESSKSPSLIISSNSFFFDIEKLKKIIYKTMQKHEKNLIISNNYSNKYHNKYGILNKEGRIIFKKTLKDLYFINDYETLSFIEEELRFRINESHLKNGVIIIPTKILFVSPPTV